MVISMENQSENDPAIESVAHNLALEVATNLADISARIKAASINASINIAAEQTVVPVSLVAVSKRQPETRIDAALEAGQRVFGENRVQEAMTRWTPRRELFPDLKLHLIGPLQTNKAAEAVALFDVIEVVDRPKMALALATEMTRQTRQLACYIQINTGEEAQKSGINPEDADDFIIFCRNEAGLNITGLMCIPPVDEEAAMHFALLQTIAQRNQITQLSMGMSADFEEAIAFGATSVRVGSAIFGNRDS